MWTAEIAVCYKYALVTLGFRAILNGNLVDQVTKRKIKIAFSILYTLGVIVAVTYIFIVSFTIPDSQI
jgi:hypothetical protein